MTIISTSSPSRARLLARACVFASVVALGACSDTPEPVAPAAAGSLASDDGADKQKNDRVAFVRWEGRSPALYVQNADGSGRRRVHFDGIKDDIAGNYPPDLHPVTDETIVAIGPVEWSPDGKQLAVVLSIGYDQSQVVVMSGDGHQQRAASPNGQYIISDIDWSPDARWVAYGMSTLPGARGVELFATDLRTNEVRRLTKGAFFGVRTELRWDERGAGLFLSEITSEQREPPFDYVNRVRHIDVVTGASETVAEGVLGDMLGLTRSGKHALMTRGIVSRDGALRSLELVELSTGRGTPLQSGPSIWNAELMAGEREALVTSNVSTDPYSTVLGFALQSLAGGRPEWLRGIPGDATVAEMTRGKK